MRKEFTKVAERILKKNKNTILILGDIGVHGFKKLFDKYPKRTLNIGILEQSTVSFAAGLAKVGYIPIVHSIAPFIVARAFEQLKIDFGYQRLRGNFVTVGGSYDYASLGCTHHCPEDINLISNIPSFQITIPGNSNEFHQLFLQSYNNKYPTYFRLSAEENKTNLKVKFGKANLLQKGNKAIIIAIGPVLNYLLKFINKYDVTLIYYTTLRPFDEKILKNIKKSSNKILIVEPFYTGSINHKVYENINDKVLIKNISIPKVFLNNYGTKKENDDNLGYNSKIIEKEVIKLLKT
jgi:transketolase